MQIRGESILYFADMIVVQSKKNLYSECVK